MKKILFINLFLVFLSSCSLQNRLPLDSYECEFAISNAVQDFKNDQFIIFASSSTLGIDIQDEYCDELEKKYGVKCKIIGQTSMPYSDCYNHYMYTKIIEKFGDVFSETRKRIKERRKKRAKRKNRF